MRYLGIQFIRVDLWACQNSAMEHFPKIVNGFESFTIFTKNLIIAMFSKVLNTLPLPKNDPYSEFSWSVFSHI